jgi:hypothetical protein
MRLVPATYGSTVREDSEPSAFVTLTVNVEAAGGIPGSKLHSQSISVPLPPDLPLLRCTSAPAALASTSPEVKTRGTDVMGKPYGRCAPDRATANQSA